MNHNMFFFYRGFESNEQSLHVLVVSFFLLLMRRSLTLFPATFVRTVGTVRRGGKLGAAAVALP